jgi:hypothetical protein
MNLKSNLKNEKREPVLAAVRGSILAAGLQ